jgi:hypothetical protein
MSAKYLIVFVNRPAAPCGFYPALLIGRVFCGNRPISARRISSAIEHHVGLLRGMEELRWVPNTSSTEHDGHGGRLTSRHGTGAALRVPNIVASTG